MSQRRPSYGSCGVNNQRVGPPSPGNGTGNTRINSTRNRKVPHSDASSVEQWLTSPKITTLENRNPHGSTKRFTNQPKHSAGRIRTTNPQNTTQSIQSQNSTNTTKGQKLLRDRMRASSVESFVSTKQPTKHASLQRSDVIDQPRNAKRFTFDDDNDDQQKMIPEVMTANHRTVSQRTYENPSLSSQPLPPHGEEPSVRRNSADSTLARSHQIRQQKMKIPSKLPFVKCHVASTDLNHNCSFDDDSVNYVSRQNDEVRKDEKRDTHPSVQRSNSSVSAVTFSSNDGKKSNDSSIAPQPEPQVRSVLYSMRDLISLGSEGLYHGETKLRRDLFQIGTVDKQGKKETYSSSKKSKKNLKPTSTTPNSCSVTAATSGTDYTTFTVESQDEISQLTNPETNSMTTPQTKGITSHASTEKVKNISTRNGKVLTSSTQTRNVSLATREKVDSTSKAQVQKRLSTSHLSDVMTTNETFTHDASAAMTALLKKTNRIKLHVYDLVENDTHLDVFGCYFPVGQCFNALNSSLHSMGTGAYHVGVEINGVEYAYGGNSTTGLTGVFTCMPKRAPGYQYRTSIDFGNRLTTRNQFVTDESSFRSVLTPVPLDGREVVREMASEYMGVDYDLLRRNCCTFAHDACIRLGVKENEIPSWIHNLAAAGAVTQDAASSTFAPITEALQSEIDKLSEYVVNEKGLKDAKAQ